MILNKINFKYLAIFSIVLCVLIQIILIASYTDAKQLSDYEEYLRLTNDCIKRGQWYPNVTNIHDDIIFAPGLVNYFILQTKIFGTIVVNMWLNLLLNLGIIFFVYDIARSCFTQRTAHIVVIAYSLLYSTWWIVIPAGTEIPFLFLSLLGLWSVVKNKQAGILFCGGIAFALANWIRPLVVIFLLTALVVMYVKKQPLKKYSALLGGFVITLSVIGLGAYETSGKVVLQSSTSGINLAYTANDKAYGG